MAVSKRREFMDNETTQEVEKILKRDRGLRPETAKNLFESFRVAYTVYKEHQDNEIRRIRGLEGRSA